MASLLQWWTDSNPNPPSPPPALTTLTAAQTLTVPGMPGHPGGPVPPPYLNAVTTIAGSIANPYKQPLPWNPLIAGSGPSTPPMGPFGPGTGGWGVPYILTKSVPNATHAVAYSYTLSAGSGTGPYTWAVTTGTLPTGLTLSTAGVLSGTVAAATAATPFSVTATDAHSLASVPQALSITVV